VHNESLDTLRRSLRGTVIDRGDPAYDDARKLYNGMIDKRPLVIARCIDVADVIVAVRFAREAGLLLAIRGGGHNGPGLGSCDDGLVIDLSINPAKFLFTQFFQFAWAAAAYLPTQTVRATTFVSSQPPVQRRARHPTGVSRFCSRPTPPNGLHRPNPDFVNRVSFLAHREEVIC
jgi:hypothetical protein